MANTKISALTAATTVGGAEQLPAVQSGGNVSVTPELLASVIAHPGYVAGRWYAPTVVAVTGTALVSDAVRLFPFMVSSRCTVSDLGVRITTAATGGHIKLGIYASNASTKMPTGSVLGSVVVATDSTGVISTTLSSNIALTPGLYWMAALPDNSTVVCVAVNQNNTVQTIASLIGDTSLSNISNGSATQIASYTTSVALGYTNGLTSLTSATFTPVTNTANALVFFKVTSVP